MAQNKTAQVLAKSLVDRISLVLPSLAITEGSVSDNPTLLVGAASAGAAGAFIKIIPQPWSALNVLGLASEVFGPHIIQIAMEANPAGGAGADVNSLAQISHLIAAVTSLGAKVEVYSSANATAPSNSTLVSGNLVAQIDANPRLGMIGNQ